MTEPSHHLINDPARIRGKRKARPEEKWNYGKRRDPRLQQRRANTASYGRQHVSIATSQEVLPPCASRPRKRRRRLVPESPLEALPPEVLQTIFAYSANIMLPLTSTQLAFKLCNSTHLRQQLSDRLLGPVLECEGATRPSENDLVSATRLLNSRFMDLAFFKTWLRSRFRGEMPMADHPSDSSDVDWKASWLACQPSRALLPPRKLFSAPFSNDKTIYLAILAQTIDDITSLSHSFGELAYEGTMLAVQSGHDELASVLLGMGVTATTDLLRTAVMDAECDERLVKLLLRPASPQEQARRGATDGVDLLDPMVWSWAEKAREKGNPKGTWLMETLREAQELRSV